MRIIELLQSLKHLLEAREELYRGFNGGTFSDADKKAIEGALDEQRKQIATDILKIATEKKVKK